MLDNKRWSVHLWYVTINNDLIFVTFLIIYLIILKHDRDRRLNIAWQIFTDVLIRPRTSNQRPVSVWLEPGLRQSKAHERSTKTTVQKRSWASYQKWASMGFMSVLLNSSVRESYTKLTVYKRTFSNLFSKDAGFRKNAHGRWSDNRGRL